MGDVEYSGFTSCEIDDGSLVGHSPEEVFMAGVQWQIAERNTTDGIEFGLFVYPWNADRVIALCRKRGYRTRLCPAGDVQQLLAVPNES